MATIQIQIKDGKSRTKKIKYHNPLKQAILTTLSFFDIFNRPLKLKSVQKYLYRTTASIQDIAIMLKRLQGEGIVQEQKGYFYLQSGSLTSEFKRRPLKIKLLSQAHKAKNILRCIPFIRSVAVCNSLVMGGVKKSSDVDLFIIVKENRIYLTRIFSILLLKICRLYQNKVGEPGKISLGFFVDEKKLNIEDISLNGNDPYLSFWVASLKPVWGFKYYYKFCRENDWVREELPNYSLRKGSPGKRTFIQKLFEKFMPLIIIDGLESLSRKLQQKRIFSLPENSWPSSTTIAEKHILKLHAEDRRGYFRKKLEEKLRENLKTI